MTINWDGYKSFNPGVYGLPDELPRRLARAVFDKVMEEKDERIEGLRRLLAANGETLADDDAGIQQLNDWLAKHVEPHPQQPGRLLPLWYAVCFDIGLFLGEVMIRRCPNLRWDLFIWGKRNVDYHRHVIMGFSKVSNPKYNIGLELPVSGVGHRAIAGKAPPDDTFLRLVKGAERFC